MRIGQFEETERRTYEKSTARVLTREDRARITKLSFILPAVVVIFTLVILGLSFSERGSFADLIGILLLCVGGMAGGSWAGFLYSTFGEETDRFKGPFGLLNAAFGGAAIADISKGDESLIVGFIKSASEFCGFEGNTAPVVFALIFYTFAGFMLTYYSRLLILNPAAQRQDNEMRELQRALRTVDASDLGMAGPGETPVLSSEEQEAVKLIVGSDLPLETAEDYRAQGQAEYYNGNYQKARELFDKALSANPSDTKALVGVAQVYLAQDNPLNAIPFLERAAGTPNPPSYVWKLLGYAYLWDENRLEESERATQRYLEENRNDNAALLNLACVYGQRGPEDLENKQKCLNLLAKVFENDPEERDTVRKLMKREGDFEEWASDEDFLRLVNPNS